MVSQLGQSYQPDPVKKRESYPGYLKWQQQWWWITALQVDLKHGHGSVHLVPKLYVHRRAAVLLQAPFT